MGGHQPNQPCQWNIPRALHSPCCMTTSSIRMDHLNLFHAYAESISVRTLFFRIFASGKIGKASVVVGCESHIK